MSDDLVMRLRSKHHHFSEVPILLEAADEIERLRAALRECAADYISPPCTVPQGAAYVAAEFQRRMETARAALKETQT